MQGDGFQTPSGIEVPAVSATEMQRVDRVAVDDVGLDLLQMMENAGRGLAWHVRDLVANRAIVVAGNGGNGGGGLACARHLANRDVSVRVVLNRPPEELTGAAAHQHRIIDAMDVPVSTGVEAVSQPNEPAVVVDALIGYGLVGEVRDPKRAYIEKMNERQGPAVSLDVPSGVEATTGETLGVAVAPERTLTLALPKTGLRAVENTVVLADIGIPSTVYDRLGIEYTNPFGESDWVGLER